MFGYISFLIFQYDEKKKVLLNRANRINVCIVARTTIYPKSKYLLKINLIYPIYSIYPKYPIYFKYPHISYIPYIRMVLYKPMDPIYP